MWRQGHDRIQPDWLRCGYQVVLQRLVDFAGSDSALKTEEKDGVIEADKAKERCQNNPAWNLPMVVGPIAFAYNIDGVDKLVLNAEVLPRSSTAPSRRE
jgi:phosphate transport system substrate-binding protein